MERHEKRGAIVIPVIVRPCDWHATPFGKLNATPPDGKPVTQYGDRDQAFLEVASAVRHAAERLKTKSARCCDESPPVAVSNARPVEPTAAARSSNRRLAKTFTDRDKDQFKRDTFEYIARFLENSLQELASRNDSVQADSRRIDANRFTPSIYRHGRSVSRCTIFIGDESFIGGSESETSRGNSFNELLTVEADELSLFLRSMGMASVRSGVDHARLTQEGAAELYWEMLIQRLQARS